jgi:hypothetical protein
VQFTQEQYRIAQKADLVAYLKTQGYNLVKDGRAYRLKEHDSLVVKGNMWYWFSRGFGGTALQFLTQYEQRSLPEAVNILANGYTASSYYSGNSNIEKEFTTDFKLPEKNSSCIRVFAYLNRIRGIDGEVIHTLIEQGKLYESRIYNNCVFVGHDIEGVARYATMRGTYTLNGKKAFRKDIDGSDKSCGFLIEGSSDLVYVFESAIDAMSHATLFKQSSLDWLKDARLSLGGVSNKALERFLLNHPNINRISFCLDNDDVGRSYCRKYADEYLKKGYAVNIELPGAKDYNEELLYIAKTQRCAMYEHEHEL